MGQNYKHTKTTVSHINCHLIFCPRYRRKIFKIPGVEARFKELTTKACEVNDIEILSIKCYEDHVHILVSFYPRQSIQNVVKKIKEATTHRLREEFPQLQNMSSLWTLSYFVSTEETIDTATREWYVNMQKKRY